MPTEDKGVKSPEHDMVLTPTHMEELTFSVPSKENKHS